MSLRTKLTVGLGFLFLIIFALALYSSYDIQTLSRDADRILRDNYDSLVYCKNMLVALDDMRTAALGAVLMPGPGGAGYSSRLLEKSREAFESNLGAEKNNITENHEGDYVKELTFDYGPFLSLCLQMISSGKSGGSYFNQMVPAYSDARNAIVRINDLNMQAIERKNLAARQSADKMTISLAVVGTILVILAFFYFWYFPFYISQTVAYLAGRMKDLLKNAGITVDTKTHDEAIVLLHSINLLENKLVTQKGKEPTSRGRQPSA
jgi:hypothetical protein